MYFNNLKELRNDNDYTQQDIAKKLDVNRFTYKNWENGIVMIPIDIADKLSVFYNVKLSYILGIDKSSKIDYKVKDLKYDKLLYNLSKLKKEHNNIMKK